MKAVLLCWIMIALSTLVSQAAFAGMDLDSEFLKATGYRGASSEVFAWDGEQGFPPIVNQSPFGACQSFEMTAHMEYLYYFETGSVAKFSEKYMAYQLLKSMIVDFEDPATGKYALPPKLGAGIAPLVIDVVTNVGVLPDANYPWGDYQAESGARNINQEVYKQVFGESTQSVFKKDEYLKFLDQAFLAPPPTAIYFVQKFFDFARGKVSEIVFKSPTEIKDFLKLSKERFTVLYNSDLKPTYNMRDPKEIEEVLKFFVSLTEFKKVKYELTQAQKITQAIKESLDRRMVVGIAADVWASSWNDRLVYSGGGGHAMVVVGYQEQNGKTYFKLRNSWGKSTGIEGYNYVEASVLEPNIFYVMLYR